MKFTVEVDEFWMHDEANFENALRDYIVSNVANQIFKKCEAIIEKDIVSKINTMVNDQLYKKSLSFIDTFLKEGTIHAEIYKDGVRKKEEISIEDYIKSKFQTDSGWGSPNESLKKIAESFGNDLKKRYDLQFAAHVVNKLAENGLLKDENVQKLLNS